MQYTQKQDKLFLNINIHKIIINIIILSLILFFILKVFFIPTITITAPSQVELNSTYTPSYEASNFFNNYNNQVTIKNKVNTSKEGNYEVTYTLKYLFLTISEKQIVNVTYSGTPTIKLIGNQEITICPNENYEEPGYEAYDDYYGDVTNKVKVFRNENTIVYSVKNRNGKEITTTRTINYIDTEKPRITLKGNSTITLTKGEQYTEPGYQVEDNCTKTSDTTVQVSGTVDTNTIGTYKLTYTATDASGNTNTITRTIKVVSNQTNKNTPTNSSSIIYLTFDDGPSSTITPKILDILKEEGVSATFFVTNKSDDLNYLLLRENNEGHTIALHTASHNYAKVYASKEAYFQDLKEIHDKVYTVTGIDSRIIRFPGGSSNTVSKKYTPGIMTDLTKEVEEQGYYYFDWNVDSDDAGSAKTQDEVYNNVVSNLKQGRSNVVLMHDFENNDKTLNALKKIIEYGKNNGYTFQKLTTTSEKIRHHVNN